MSSTEVIESADRLAAVVPQWRELWSRAPTVTPFQSPDWLMPWWDIFAPGELRVIAIWERDALIGISPLYLETTPERRRMLPLGISLSDYLDVVFEGDRFEEVANAFFSALDRLDGVGECEFPETPAEGQVLRIPVFGNWAREDSPASACPILALPETVTALGEKISSSRLRHLRTARRRAARRGQTAILVGDVDNVEALLDALVRLELQRWQNGIFSDSRVADFHAAALPGLMERGLARMYALAIGEKTVGVWYGFFHRGRTYAYLCAFDPYYRFESPGAILIGHAIEEAVREGANAFDFLRGREAYKYEWGAKDRVNTRRVFRRHPS